LVANVFNHLFFGGALPRLVALLLAGALGGCSILANDGDEKAQEALALIEQRRIAEARLAIAEAIEANDENPDYYLVSAQIEMVADAPVNAFVAYNNALALDSANRNALMGVARVALEIGRVGESQRAVERLLSLEPNNSDALVIQGFLQFVRKDYEEARDTARRIQQITPRDEAGTILLVRSQIMLDETDDALAELARWEDSYGVTESSARTRLEIGRFRGDAEAMERAFAFLLDNQADDNELGIDYANFLFKRGDRAGAAAEILAVLNRAPEGSDQPRRALSLVREYDGEPALVGALAEQVADLRPAVNKELARLFTDAGLFDPAAALLDKASGFDASATRAWLSYRSGNAQEARRIVSDVLDKDPDNCTALVVAAQLALAEERHGDAVRYGQRSSAQCDTEEQAWTVTALAYSAKGDAANARRVFRQGIEAIPQDTAMTASYTSWLLDRGATREAISAARKLTRRAPALQSAWRLYADVCDAALRPCAGRAQEGLKEAQVTYGIDLKPGERTAPGLFGRLARR
jgi:tetratricopeptide (TPR) repeat protein